ncbi:thiol-disulfide isomerase/thioredoxin [Paraburkholderia sp. GAS199]|uniref:TlpA family protein disulfide reductase n=1 Tax=Paraburkholderia sp. GAS199 TaxID=3035126 RepID=UPI003D1E6DC5
MTIGPFTFPVAPLILLLSIGVAMGVARLVGRGAPQADSAILSSVLAGLVVARLSFVAHYLPAYRGSPLKMLDFRDLGFDAAPGVVAGALLLVVLIALRRGARKAVVFAALAGCVSWGLASAYADAGQEPAYLPAVSVVDMKGNPLPLALHDGKPLVVNLWASWCGPCRAEMPVLAEAQSEFDGVNIAFVNQGESAQTVNGFLAQEGISLRNLARDPTLAVARAVGARAFPTTLFYDGSGKLMAVHLGPFSRATFQHALETLYPDTPLSTRH